MNLFSLNSFKYSLIICASFGTINDNQFTFLLVAPDLENDTFPSVTAFSIAAVISHGTELHKAAHSAISFSSKCQ